jgi:hypothetical protein
VLSDGYSWIDVQSLNPKLADELRKNEKCP